MYVWLRVIARVRRQEIRCAELLLFCGVCNVVYAHAHVVHIIRHHVHKQRTQIDLNTPNITYKNIPYIFNVIHMIIHTNLHRDVRMG